MIKMTKDQLMKKYKKLFVRKKLPITESCMGWGIECGEGWLWILDLLCGSIQNYIDNSILNGSKPKQVEFSQVKEKFGALRVYCVYSDEHVDAMIDFAEYISGKTCEKCGTMENVKRRDMGWITTLCKECHKKGRGK